MTTPADAPVDVPTPKAGNVTPSTKRVPKPPHNANTGSLNSHTNYNASGSAAGRRLVAKKHEEFKNQLVHDVFARDNRGRVPMEKVTMLIWQFRDSQEVVRFMAQFVATVSPFYIRAGWVGGWVISWASQPR